MSLISDILWKARFKLGLIKCKALGVIIDEKCLIDWSVKLANPRKLRIEESVEIRDNCFLNGRTLESIGISIGKRCRIKDSVAIDSYGGRVFLGNDVLVGRGCTIFGHGGVVIGNDVMIGPNVLIVASDHIATMEETVFQKNGFTREPISISSDVWIGGNVTILAGATIDSKVVVAAGSVVSGRLEKGFVYAGQPAKKIKAVDFLPPLNKEIYHKDWSLFK